jgi:hypothetical protein
MWSEEARVTTKEVLEQMPTAMMKHEDRRFGIFVKEGEKYSVVELETKIKHQYDSLEAMMDNGWVVD